MTDLLTTEESALAAQAGWSLNHVFDLTTNRWRVMVLGMPNADLHGRNVVAHARMGNPLCIKALRLVMASHQGTV